MYAIRINHLPNPEENEAYLSEIHSYVEKRSTSWAQVFELGEHRNNPHFHYYSVSEAKIDAYRTGLKKIIAKYQSLGTAKKGNGCYSCAHVQDKIQYLNYLTKESVPTYFNVSQEDIDAAAQYQDAYEAAQKTKAEKTKSFFPSLREEAKKQAFWGKLCSDKSLEVTEKKCYRWTQESGSRSYHDVDIVLSDESQVACRELMDFIIEAYKRDERLIRVSMIQVHYDTLLTEAGSYYHLYNRLKF